MSGLNAPAGDPRIAFWIYPELWPDDPPGYLFLGRAVQYLGHLIYGDGWLGTEPATEVVTPLPEHYLASMPPAELQRGCRLLYEHHDAYRARYPDAARLMQYWPMPTEQEWGEAVAISRALAKQSQADFGRFVEVTSRLVRAFRGGNIKTATREVGGGEMFEQSQWFWNTENFWGRFHTCRVDPFSPYEAGVITDSGEYMFVEVSSWQAALQPPPQEPKPEPVELNPPAEAEYLSPYLRCMIAATRALKITADDQRKKDEIIAALPEYWTGSGKLTRADIDRMATLMREPEHKRGRGRRKKKG